MHPGDDEVEQAVISQKEEGAKNMLTLSREVDEHRCGICFRGKAAPVEVFQVIVIVPGVWGLERISCPLKNPPFMREPGDALCKQRHNPILRPGEPWLRRGAMAITEENESIGNQMDHPALHKG
jgi:hypothetical protein